jgi:uncharacterized cupredoxin-like copper-binding protein
MTRWGRVTLVLAAAWLAVAGAAAAYAFTAGDSDDPLGPDDAAITLRVDHSRFTPGRITVVEGTTVTFTIVNNDPIGHEFIVGGPQVHKVHKNGKHGKHGTVPGEVSVAPGVSASATYTFGEPGDVLFACHLPGHFAYGMVGEVNVIPK